MSFSLRLTEEERLLAESYAKLHSISVGEKDVPFIKENEERLIHFHIHDGSENPPKNHLALGDGEIDMADRLRSAENRNARCVLETKTIEALRKSVSWLENRR